MDIWEYALGFMDAQILLTAEELGIFNILATGHRTVKEPPVKRGSQGNVPGHFGGRLPWLLISFTVHFQLWGHVSYGAMRVISILRLSLRP
jgi:hypothetical protein